MTLNLQQQDIDRFRDLVAERYGLNLDNGNQDRVREVLARGVQRTGCGDASIYVQRLLEHACAPAEAAALVEDLTVAETYFFRHHDQFRALLERVILPRAREPRRGGLRMLSAGCASGEEAYSLAILLCDHVTERASRDLEIVAIDLNAGLLAKAAQARYTPWSLRGVDEEIRRRHFAAVGSDFVLQAPVRELATFTHGNLMDDHLCRRWPSESFDVIFCRNVIMYFTPEAARTVIARLARLLVPGGLLFLGPAETLRGLSGDFHLQHSHGTFYYQRKSANEQARPYTADAEVAWQPAEPCPPVAITPDESWVTTICGAAERIASLSRSAFAASSSKSGAPAGLAAEGDFDRLCSARQLVLEERFDDALRLLQALPIQEGQSSDAQLLAAAVLTNTGRVREAEQLCRAVLASDELNAEAHYLLALCREHAGEAATAIEQDQMAIYLDPQFAMPHLHVGLLAKRAGDHRAAQRAFRQAAALLAREDASRIVLFGGGFGREALIQLCRTELRSGEDFR